MGLVLRIFASLPSSVTGLLCLNLTSSLFIAMRISYTEDDHPLFKQSERDSGGLSEVNSMILNAQHWSGSR